MWVGLDLFGQMLVDATLATASLLSLVILLMLLCQQPTRRIVLAQAAIILVLFILPLIAISPLLRWNTPAWLTVMDPGMSRSPSAAIEAGAFPGQSPGDPDTIERSPTGSPREATWWQGRWPFRVLTIAYVTGVTVAMFWTLLGLWGTQRLVAKSVEPSQATRSLYDELSLQTDGRRHLPGLGVSARIHRPVLVGLFRPFILIPPATNEPDFDKESLKIILLHELAHAAKGDTYFSAAASLAQSLWFFLPLLWWMRAQLRIDQEFLADNKVVTLTGSPAGYATRLVALATPRKGQISTSTTEKILPSRSGGWANDGFHSPLLQRVLMLLHCPFPLERKPPRWWALSAWLLVVGLAVLSVCVSLALVDRSSSSSRFSFLVGAPNRFHVSQFVASPQKINSHGRSPFYTLPVLLPPQFVLDVEIQATLTALARMRLVGLTLDSPPSDAGTDAYLKSASSSASWHRIQVRRQNGQVSLTVDGMAVPANRDSEGPSQWLTVEPASNETAILRNLVLTW